MDHLDTSVAHPARRYNYWLGGKDHFAADRESGDLLAAAFPTARIAARENDDDRATAIVRRLLDALPAGSFLVASNLTLDYAPPEQVAKHEELLAAGRTDARARSRAQFGRFFAGLELVEPGIVAVSDWRPDRPESERASAVDVAIHGAVGRLP